MLEPYWLERAQQLGSRLDLRAHVELVKDLSTSVFKVSECGGADCTRDNTFRLDGVPITTPQALTVQPVYLRGAYPELKDAETALDKVRQLYPGGERVVIRGGNLPTIDIRYQSQLTKERDVFFCAGLSKVDAGTRFCRMRATSR